MKRSTTAFDLPSDRSRCAGAEVVMNASLKEAAVNIALTLQMLR